MRAFIAIDFSSLLKDQIAGLQRELRPFASSVRWKYIDNFHLTLKFLGEIEPGKIEGIGEEVGKICRPLAPFSLKVSNIGCFPGKDSFRVVWLGLSGDLDRLRSLQSEIDTCLGKLGFEIEKRSYKPHVTIAQDVVFNTGFEKISEIASKISFSDIYVDRVYLIKSEQIGARRVYTPVSGYCFG